MTEQQAAEPQAQPETRVLGRDEPEIVNAPPEPVKPEAVAEAPAPKYTDDQLEAIEAKANQFDQMMGTPQYRDAIIDVSRSLRGQPIEAAKPEPEPAKGQMDPEIMQRLEQLEMQNTVYRAIAERPALADESERQRLGKFITDNDIQSTDLPRIYDLMLRSNETQSRNQPKAPKLESSEGSHQGVTQEAPEAGKLAELRRKARTPGDATEFAFREAMIELGMQE